MSEEQIFELIVAEITQSSLESQNGTRVRILSDSTVGSVTPEETERVLDRLVGAGMLEILSEKDIGGNFTSFDLLLLEPFLQQIQKAIKRVPLAAPEDLSPDNFSAIVDLMNQIRVILEMTRDSEVILSATRVNQSALAYLKESGCFSGVSEEHGERPMRHDYIISIDRPAFANFYERIKGINDTRQHPEKESVTVVVPSSQGFSFDQGILFQHGSSFVEKFLEDTFEHELLLVAFKSPFGERIDGATPEFLDREWRTIYDAARRINDKVMVRFAIADFFKIDYKNKFIERSAK